jgi:hypothetical protein
MTDGIARRRFLTQLTCALSVTATGGDLLEAVPWGELPSFARAAGRRSRRSTAMRWHTARRCSISCVSAAAGRSGTGITPIAAWPNGTRMAP